MTWLVVILGLALLVFLHELGHFTVAWLVGVKPRALYVGFPPALAKVRHNGIEYGIGAVPLGGYTRIPGMRRPTADDFEALISPALREDSTLGSAADAVQRLLAAEKLDAARAALPALTSTLEQRTSASPRAAPQRRRCATSMRGQVRTRSGVSRPGSASRRSRQAPA